MRVIGRSEGDFHCHSSRSDGVLSPTDLVDLAYKNGVRTFALTDHDTLDGIDEARAAVARHSGMRLIPGVELSCDVPGTEVHMLGLFVDPEDAAFRSILRKFQDDRIERGQKVLAALASMGVSIEWSRVLEIAGEASVGRPHIARAMIERGHVASTEEAFATYLAYDSPAYVEREKLVPADAIEMIHSAGGLAVFAHPLLTKEHEQIASELAAAGLDGLEAYYRYFNPEQVAALLELAERLQLTPTGGSDYHGNGRENEVEPGVFNMPTEAIERLLDEASARGCVVPQIIR